MLALAIPAFQRPPTSDWLKQVRHRRHLPRPLRQRDRPARHPAQRRGAARRDARPSHQGGARHRGPPLLRAFRHRLPRHGPRPGRERARQRRRAGRLVDHPAARQEPVPVNERTIERKIKEAFLALWLEIASDQARDPEALSRPRLYGRRHLRRRGGGRNSTSASRSRDVNLAEAAMLAGLFKAPSKYAPHVNLPAARARANDVLTNLVEAGFMTEGQVLGARRNPADVVDRADAQRPTTSSTGPSTRCSELVDEPKLDNERVFVVAHHDRLDMQQAGRRRDRERRCAQYGTRLQRHARRAMVVDDPDGAVRAMVGGRDYGESQFNRATDALRQPGSSFKPYVYATALMNGFTPTSIVVDGPICIGNWCPQNYGHSYLRPGDADHGDHPLDQRHPGQAVARARQGANPADRPRHDHRDRAPLGHRDAAARHAGAADRRRRSQRARDAGAYATSPRAARR